MCTRKVSWAGNSSSFRRVVPIDHLGARRFLPQFTRPGGGQILPAYIYILARLHTDIALLASVLLAVVLFFLMALHVFRRRRACAEGPVTVDRVYSDLPAIGLIYNEMT